MKTAALLILTLALSSAAHAVTVTLEIKPKSKSITVLDGRFNVVMRVHPFMPGFGDSEILFAEKESSSFVKFEIAAGLYQINIGEGETSKWSSYFLAVGEEKSFLSPDQVRGVQAQLSSSCSAEFTK